VAISPDGRHTISQFTATVCAAGGITGSHSRRLVPILHGDLLFAFTNTYNESTWIASEISNGSPQHMIIPIRIGL